MTNPGDGVGGKERLPIKLILPEQGTSRAVPGGGSKGKPFQDVNDAFRSSLNAQVSAIEQALAPHLLRVGAAAVRVQLLPRALAKSHRPEKLFSDATCPIIGAGRMGELFVRATPNGLRALGREIRTADSDRMVKELSTVQVIEAVTPVARRKKRTAEAVLADCPRRGSDRFVTRVRLFDLGDGGQQQRSFEEFRTRCEELKLEVSGSGYSATSGVYAVQCKTVADIEALSGIVSVRSITGMPLVRMIRGQGLNEAMLPEDLPTPADIEGDYPVVAVVDSGISERVADLQGWVAGRTQLVAPTYRNTAHGTFVAGLIVWGDRLNPHLPDISDQPCGVFDLAVLPNGDPSLGDTDTLTEQELLQALEESLQQNANRFKVWNLSLSTSEVCAEDEFSAFAEQLDSLQEAYQVSFVIAAGNYETRPLLDYPRIGSQLAAGRITAPADSVLGITVGALSHLDYQTGGPRLNQPSPFSRHGAGPNYIIKPDLIHYGGTCSTDAQHISGIRSVTERGTAEDLGTSFATPIIARSLAQVYHQITPTPSPVLARALLTHHARDPRTGGRIPTGDEDVFGFGRPLPPPSCLSCDPHLSTLVFEDVLRPGFYLEWDDFPYPPSLRRGGKYFGEVSVTIAFAPARGSRWGTEYCETHIDAHFGVYRKVKNRKTGVVREKFEGLVPPEHSNASRLYEDVQVRELRKWAPVRTYHADLNHGERGDRWRLKVQLLTRHGVEDREALQSQPFALIVTIADVDRQRPIYDEMAQLIHSRYKSANLAVRASARIRPRG